MFNEPLACEGLPAGWSSLSARSRGKGEGIETRFQIENHHGPFRDVVGVHTEACKFRRGSEKGELFLSNLGLPR